MQNFIRSAALAAAMMLPQSGNAQTAPGTENAKVVTVTAALAALHKALDKDPVHQTEVANLAPRVRDGTIDSTDDEAIRTLGAALYKEYASNPAMREKIMGVANALWPKEAWNQETGAKNPDTLHADTNTKKPLPPIGWYTKEQQAAIKEQERLQKMRETSAKALTGNILNGNWKLEASNTLKATITPWKKALELVGSDKDLDPNHEAKIDLTTTLAPWDYDITITTNSAEPFYLYLYGNNPGAISMAGTLIPEGTSKSVAKFESGKTVRVKIPTTIKNCMLQTRVTPNNRTLNINAASVKVADPEAWTVAQTK